MVFDTPPTWIRVTSLICAALLIPGDMSMLVAQESKQPASQPAAAPLQPEYLESLIAPIALYPDPLLAQVLAASTYPLEIVQLQQWLAQHKDLKGKALADAVGREKWDPSVQGMADLPDVVKQLADNIKWTSELGNAFLAQQSDVMNAVQRMRGKAQSAGKLKSNEQMKVETKVVESKTVVVIEQANPQVIYVPSYDPAVVWGAAPPMYAYPPVYYPPAGYYAAGMAISFGVGVAMGAFWGGGGWGYNAGWGGNNNININNNNNFVRNTNATRNSVSGGNRVGNGNRPSQWQHNPQHRGGAPYGDRKTADRFGGTTRGDSAAKRQASARQNVGRNGGADGLGGNRNGPGGSNGLGGNRNGAGGSNGLTGNRNGLGGADGLGGNRGGPGGNAFSGNRGGAGNGIGGDRGGTGNRGGAGGGDRVGNRQVPSGGGGGGAFSGSRSGGAAARSSGSRGASSFGGGGGGARRGGGGGGRRR